LQHIARTLLDFNGGSSCVQTYVAQHAFFINLLKLGQNEMDEDVEGRGYELKDKNQQELARLYDEIRQTVTNEWDAIYKVFPNALSVMQGFVQRIFAQPIQNFLENLLSNAAQKSPEEFLDALFVAHTETAKLVADLHKMDETIISSAIGAASLTSIINRSFEDLFVPYVDNERYIKAERACMVSQFQEHLKVFNGFLVFRS
jgi:exocyst complex component 5